MRPRPRAAGPEEPAAEVERAPRRSGRGRRSRRGPTGSPSRATIWGSVAAVSCWGTASVTRRRATTTSPPGWAVPVHPHPGELGPGVGRREMESPGQAGVRSSTDRHPSRGRTGYGPWSPMQTLTVSAVCSGHRAHGERHPRPCPPGCAVAPLHPLSGGGSLNVTSGSTWTCGDARGADAVQALSPRASAAAVMATLRIPPCRRTA